MTPTDRPSRDGRQPRSALPSGGWPALGLALLVGCQPPAPGPQRWIEDDPQATFALDRLRGASESFRWALAGDGAIAAWRHHPPDLALEETDGGLAVRAHTADPQLWREVDLDAAAIGALRVAVAGLERGSVELFWAARGEPFHRDRSLRFRPREAVEHAPPVRVFEFPVGRHPGWRGSISRLRIDPTTSAGERVVVRWVAGLPREPSAEELRSVTGRPWKVTFGGQLRNALLALPGDAVEREVVTPAQGRLLLEYGVACSDSPASEERPAVRLEALVGREGRPPETVWEVRLEGADLAGATRWTPQEVDLRADRGERVRVSLRASGEPQDAAPACLAAFANPEVTAPALEPPGPNVIVVSIDTLRADRLSLYGHHRATSPVLDAWARRRGVTFTTVVAQAGWTLPSHVSMLTGLGALRHGANFNSAAPRSLTFVAEVFRRAGYRTAAFTGGGWMSPTYGFSQGFDRYDHWADQDGAQELEGNMDRLLDWLSAHRERRFFALFHTYEVHGPYRPRQPYFDRFYQGPLRDRAGDLDLAPPRANTGMVDHRVDLAWRETTLQPPPPREQALELVSALYDAGIAYADDQLGRLLRRLEELGLEDETVVVFTSDHGEALGQHGLQGHGYLFDHNLLVPLVIAAPGLRGGSVVEGQVRSMDLAPTLVELAGLPPLASVDGRSLVPMMRGGEEAGADREAWSYAPKSNRGIALRTSRKVKFRLNDAPWPGLRGSEALFRLDRDPAELDNAVDRFAIAAHLRRRVLRQMEVVPALRVRLSADGRGLRGRLRGGMIQPLMIKTVDLPCDCLRFDPPGSVEFEVPPGTAYHLLIQGRPHGSITIEDLHFDGEPATAWPQLLGLEVDDLRSSRAPRSVSWVDGRWELAHEPREPAAPGLALWWSGEPAEVVAEEPTPPAAPDPELTERLRALGYIEQ